MNAVTGTTFTAKLPIFSGSRFSAKFIKDVIITARVTRDCCYDSNNRHWVHFEVVATDDPDSYKIGKQYKKQGKNFYPAVSSYEYPADYEELAAYKDQHKATHGIGVGRVMPQLAACSKKATRPPTVDRCCDGV